MEHITLGLFVATSLILLHFAGKVIINLVFHPLSSYPGPRLWAISRFPYVVTLWQGELHTRVKELHDRYGSVVRIAPNELSYIDATAWKDIYSGQVGNKGFPKNNVISGAQGFYSLTDANDQDHSRFRGVIQKSFSAQALQAREDMFQRYVGLLIQSLKEAIKPVSPENEKDGEEDGVVNIVKHLNWTTFDITGELTFSESFGCLEGQITNPWISLIFSHLKASALLIGLRFYYPLDEYLMWLLPKSLQKEKERYISLSKAKVHRRIDQPPKGKPADFMTPALQLLGHEDGMSLQEIEGTFTTLIIGGSETTATTIAGMTNYLCKSPESLARLVTEIREFESESDLTLIKLSHLPYLNAVIQEGLRLCTPLPVGLSRIVAPGGAIISGKFVAGGMSVAVAQYAAYSSAQNFQQPDSFVPGRWLKDSPFPSDNHAVLQPFFVGGRNCLGQNIAWAEMRLVMARLIYNFDITPVDTLDWATQKTYYLWQKEQFWVRLSAVVR